jgi:signal transduction histidine kinase
MPGNRDDLGDYIKLMGQKASQLDHFISDVLSHSKNLKMEILVDRVDIGGIIEKTFRDLNYLTGADQIQTTVSVTGGDFCSDQWRVAEIFRNLISNAIKYRKVGQTGSRLSVSVDTHHDQTTIIVEDNGIGIDEVHLPRIFEMFFRASNQSEGSGLGLYIVKNAIDKLGGSVTVESQTGEGARFVIILPNHIGK